MNFDIILTHLFAMSLSVIVGGIGFSLIILYDRRQGYGYLCK